MKKLIAALLALVLISCAAMAEGNWYVEEGQALVARMQALAADEAYASLMGSGNDETKALKDEFVQADLSKPTGTWFLPLPEGEALLSALERLAAMGGAEADLGAINELSDVGLEELVKRLPAAASTMLAAREGVSWVVLSNQVSVNQGREEPEGFKPGFLLMEYPGNFAALITFTRPLPGFVNVSALPVPAGSLETFQPVLDYAKLLGLPLELEEWEGK